MCLQTTRNPSTGVLLFLYLGLQRYARRDHVGRQQRACFIWIFLVFFFVRLNDDGIYISTLPLSSSAAAAARVSTKRTITQEEREADPTHTTTTRRTDRPQHRHGRAHPARARRGRHRRGGAPQVGGAHESRHALSILWGFGFGMAIGCFVRLVVIGVTRRAKVKARRVDPPRTNLSPTETQRIHSHTHKQPSTHRTPPALPRPWHTHQ